MGFGSGKHGAGYAKYDKRDYYQSSDYSDVSSEQSSAKGVQKSVRFSDSAVGTPSPASPATMSELERKLSSMQKDVAQQLHFSSEKGTEKFDLIFAILTELQSGQAQLEDSIREIQRHAINCQMGCVAPNLFPQSQINGEGQQQPHQGKLDGCSGNVQACGQVDGVMSAPMMGQEMGSQQPMPQMIMQPDGTQAMLIPVPRMIVMQPPACGMMVPQMMPPGGQMQPMQPPMAVQFIGQSPMGQDMGSFGESQAAGVEGLPLPDVADGAAPAPEATKIEGSDIDSTDTPTTAFSE